MLAMPKAIAVMIFVLALAAAAQAAPAGSNIALSEYPGPSCTKPLAPAQPQPPPDDNVSGAVAGYNLKVQQYNKAIAVYNTALTAFGACMQTYIENGNADMQRIKQRLDQAVAAANAH
jgi:hypothetical protein